MGSGARRWRGAGCGPAASSARHSERRSGGAQGTVQRLSGCAEAGAALTVFRLHQVRCHAAALRGRLPPPPQRESARRCDVRRWRALRAVSKLLAALQRGRLRLFTAAPSPQSTLLPGSLLSLTAVYSPSRQSTLLHGNLLSKGTRARPKENLEYFSRRDSFFRVGALGALRVQSLASHPGTRAGGRPARLSPRGPHEHHASDAVPCELARKVHAPRPPQRRSEVGPRLLRVCSQHGLQLTDSL